MAATLGVMSGRFTGTGVQVAVAGSALADASGAVLVESTAGVFLLARTSASGFTAVDAICSHESCTITGADGSTYVCQCHGSRYNRSGQVMAGPAKASLRQYATTFTDGVARTFFSRTDDTYPDATVLLSREITPNAVHRRTWIPAEERHVFEYVGNV